MKCPLTAIGTGVMTVVFLELYLFTVDIARIKSTNHNSFYDQQQKGGASTAETKELDAADDSHTTNSGERTSSTRTRNCVASKSLKNDTASTDIQCTNTISTKNATRQPIRPFVDANASNFTVSAIKSVMNDSDPKQQRPEETKKEISRLENLRIAFLGDSVTRYQYKSLIHYLYTGNWSNGGDLSIVKKPANDTWESYHNSSKTFFHGYEQCDQFRPKILYHKDRETYRRMFENFYYSDPAQNNFLTYITKLGFFPSQGTWKPWDVYQNDHGRQRKRPSWQFNWTQVISYHIALLNPKPDYLIFNAGIWAHDLYNASVLKLVRKTLDEVHITGIYKTTTRARSENWTWTADYEVQACQIMHHCLNLSWTGKLSEESYGDELHFAVQPNQLFNKQLLNLLQEIEDTG